MNIKRILCLVAAALVLISALLLWYFMATEMPEDDSGEEPVVSETGQPEVTDTQAPESTDTQPPKETETQPSEESETQPTEDPVPPEETEIQPTDEPEGGEDEGDNALEITSRDELERIGYGRNGWTMDADYVLTADITISGNWKPIGDADEAFNGTFDGNGYTITFDGATCSKVEGAGLFGITGTDATIKNLRTGGELTAMSGGSLSVGAVVGINYGSVEGCISETGVTAMVTPDFNQMLAEVNVGGLVGTNVGTIKQCVSSGDVQAADGGEGTAARAGGIVGKNTSFVLECWSASTVLAEASGESISASAGGIVGYAVIGQVKTCVALSPSISAVAKESWSSVGRILGSEGGEYESNLAIDMTLTASGTAATGTERVDATPDGKDGQSITLEEATQAETYGEKYGLNWDFDAVWRIQDGEGYPEQITDNRY